MTEPGRPRQHYRIEHRPPRGVPVVLGEQRLLSPAFFAADKAVRRLASAGREGEVAIVDQWLSPERDVRVSAIPSGPRSS
jgi:hypothetical protein